MSIKVKELLELLQKCNPEDNVSFAMNSGCCGEWEDMEFDDVSHYEGTNKVKNPDGTIEHTPYSYPFIRLAPLPGYGSCRQAGATKRAHEKYWLKKNGSHRPTVEINDIDLAQAFEWADSQTRFANHRYDKWLEHFKRAIGMIQ